jgi:glycosyltransferase involved in cell wall biosynthesis
MFYGLSGSQKLLLSACKSVKLRLASGFIPVDARRYFRGIAQRLAFRNLKEPIRFEPFSQIEKASSATTFFSIIIPIFNNADFLESCLRSALAQDPEISEVICINDASPDPRVAEIIERIQREFPTLRAASNLQNMGISKTQNALIDLARGKFIAFLDCDDVLKPDAIKEVAKALANSTIYLHTATALKVVTNGRLTVERSKYLPRKSYLFENRHMFFAKHLKVINKSALKRVGGFRKKYDSAQDLDITLKLAHYFPSNEFQYLDKVLYVHHIHEQQTTSVQRKRQDESTFQIESESDKRYLTNFHRKTILDNFVVRIDPSEGETLENWNSITQLTTMSKIITVIADKEVVLDENWLDEALAIFESDSSVVAIRPRFVEENDPWYEVVPSDLPVENTITRIVFNNRVNDRNFAFLDNDYLYVPAIQSVRISQSKSSDFTY